MVNVHIGSDHGGFALKEALKDALAQDEGVLVDDYGKEFVEDDDYTDVAEMVAHATNQDRSFGVLMCRTGIGMSIVANKFKGVRAALCRSVADARMARNHNNANICCIGADVTKPSDALAIIRAFISEEFHGNMDGGERHLRRVNKIDMIEKSIYK